MFAGTVIGPTWAMASSSAVNELPMSCCATNARRRSIEGKRASKSDQPGTEETGWRVCPRRDDVIRDEQTQFSSGPLEPRTVTLDPMRKRRPDPIDVLIDTHLWLRAQERKARKPQLERTATARPAARSPVKGGPRRTSR
jgi:hypothetical protein